ncbi:hypothetical protein BH11PLA1_BH11PLA1_17330 [soil metagenome]
MRLYVAAYPPAPWCTLALHGAEKFIPDKVRVTASEQLHITLVFIGTVRAAQLTETFESVERAAAGMRAIEVAPTRYCTLPRGAGPRLLALEFAAAPMLMELQRRLAARLAKANERGREFLPHATIARLDPRGSAPEVAAPAPHHLGPTTIDGVVLMASVLSGRGARHEVLHRVALGTER